MWALHFTTVFKPEGLDRRDMVLKSIQVMRAIAALSVVLFHLGVYGFSNGAAGVDIFFVISGFIMGATSLKLPAAAFVFKRLVRIVPLY